MTTTHRTTIVAPHPDDEVFGIGGLMLELVGRGHELRIVAVTDGEAAYGAATAAERDALGERRDSERAQALRALGVSEHTEVIRLGLPDAAVTDHEDELAERLAELTGPLLFATWRHDGHPDHDAVGRAAATAAAAQEIRLFEYPVWAAHRDRLTGERVDGVRRIALSSATRAAKMHAVAAYRSQLEPSPDGRPVVPAELVERLRADDEVLFG